MGREREEAKEVQFQVFKCIKWYVETLLSSIYSTKMFMDTQTIIVVYKYLKINLSIIIDEKKNSHNLGFNAVLLCVSFKKVTAIGRTLKREKFIVHNTKIFQQVFFWVSRAHFTKVNCTSLNYLSSDDVRSELKKTSISSDCTAIAGLTWMGHG